MRPLSAPPFSAIDIYLGDTGTRGGLLICEHARVIETEASSRDCAAGNASATVITELPAAGGTLAPATTFAYIAASHFKQAKE